MKDEIKEILDFIKEQIKRETLSYEPDVELSKEEAKLLLDYITNLQEENEKIKELCDRYEKEHKTTFEIWKKDIIKIDKAIEWINKHISKYEGKGIAIIDWDELSDPRKLLEILGDKE